MPHEGEDRVVALVTMDSATAAVGPLPAQGSTLALWCCIAAVPKTCQRAPQTIWGYADEWSRRCTSFHLMAFHRRYHLQQRARSNRDVAYERSVVSGDQ
jgi:hypothetical protein